MNQRFDYNYVFLIGKMENPFKFAYYENGEAVYSSIIHVARLSGEVDKIPLEIKESLLSGIDKEILSGRIKIVGHIASATRNGRLRFNVRVDEQILAAEETERDLNHVKLSGAICSEIKIRNRLNDKTVCDFRLASSSENQVKAYVPIIAWNNLAWFINSLRCGIRLYVVGRIQSRNFDVKKQDGTYETRVSYEVSIRKIRKVK